MAFVSELFGGFTVAPRLNSCDLASYADAMSAAALSPKFKVFAKKSMSTRAVRLRGIYGRGRVPPERVYSPGYSLKMFWIYANSISAKMVNAKAIEDWANMQFVRKTMGIVILTSCVEFTIKKLRALPCWKTWSGPYPARICFADSLNKTLTPSFKNLFLNHHDLINNFGARCKTE